MATAPYKFRRAPKKKEPVPAPYQTSLERQPEYLRAIGTLQVEIVNLEVMLADLVATLLRVPENVGAAIYFAPQATGPRLEIGLKVCENIPVKHKSYADEATKHFYKAREYANKRNTTIHEAWGLTEDSTKAMRRTLPFGGKGQPKHVPLTEIQTDITNVRTLITKVVYLARSIQYDAAYAPWPHRSSEQEAPASEDPIRPKPRGQKRKRPPRSSPA